METNRMKEARANVSLALAAPDLLAALQALVNNAGQDDHNTWERKLRQARAAITKATEGV